MTILVYHGPSDCLFVDSQYSYDRTDGRKSYMDTKVEHVAYSRPDGELIVEPISLCGNVVVAAIVLTLLRAAWERAQGPVMRVEAPGFAADTSCCGFMRISGVVHAVNMGYGWIDVFPMAKSAEHAEGSGSTWYYAYRALGHSPREAIELVTLHHQSCGGRVEVF